MLSNECLMLFIDTFNNMEHLWAAMGMKISWRRLKSQLVDLHQSRIWFVKYNHLHGRKWDSIEIVTTILMVVWKDTAYTVISKLSPFIGIIEVYQVIKHLL